MNDIMATPLRIEYPDSWYYGVKCGRRAELIFSDRQDYLMITQLMRETGDSYLLHAVRHIHRNPLCAGWVEGMDVYSWSSHKGYLSIAGEREWLHKKYDLSLLRKNRKEWLRSYNEWVSDEDEVGKKPAVPLPT